MTTAAFARWAAASAAALALPGVCLADSPGGGGAKSVLEPNLVNSAVTLLVFLGLLAVLYKFAWGPILKGLEARETAQFQAIADAKKAKEEAAAMRTQLQAEMAKVAAQVKDILDEARRDADALKVSEREVGVKDAAAIVERAKREIATAQEAMVKEVYEQAVKLASLMSEKALRRSVSADDHRRLLDESIAELKTAANKA